MRDVLRSTTTVHGAPCVMMVLATTTHKSHVLCSDLGEFLLAVSSYLMHSPFSHQRAPDVRVVTCSEFRPGRTGIKWRYVGRWFGTTERLHEYGLIFSGCWTACGCCKRATDLQERGHGHNKNCVLHPLTRVDDVNFCRFICHGRALHAVMYKTT